MKETEIAAAVVAWLTAEGFEVYQEVEVRPGILDIAARRRPVVWAIETKVRLNYEVIAQAERWVPHVHRAVVACPCHWPLHPYDQALFDRLGLGLVSVHGGDGARLECVHRIDARLNVHSDGAVARALREEHKTYSQAGQSGGPRWTRWKSLCKDFRAYVRDHPGCTAREAVLGMQAKAAKFGQAGRYGAAASSLLRGVKGGYVPGVRCEAGAIGHQHATRGLRLYTTPLPSDLPCGHDRTNLVQGDCYACRYLSGQP